VESDDGSRLYIDDKLVIDNWRDQAPNEVPGTVELEANKRYNIRIEYYQGGGGAMMRFSGKLQAARKKWCPPRICFPPMRPRHRPSGRV
jgi:hypothetical protein